VSATLIFSFSSVQAAAAKVDKETSL